jgi:hypothetical protein
LFLTDILFKLFCLIFFFSKRYIMDYDYANSFENFNNFRDATQQEALKKRETGEVLLGFVDPLLMKGTETAIKSWITKRANNLKFRAQEQARMGEGGEEGEVPDVYEPTVVPEGLMGPTAQQQIMDFDPEQPFLPTPSVAPQAAEVGAEGAEAASAGAEDAEAGEILGEGAELALDTSAMPEISAVIGIGAVLASSAVAFVDLFKHEKTPPPPMTNLPQIGL